MEPVSPSIFTAVKKKSGIAAFLAHMEFIHLDFPVQLESQGPILHRSMDILRPHPCQ